MSDKPVAWRYENKNVKGNWYITWTEPPDGFNKRPLYEAPQICDLEQQLAVKDEQIKILRGAIQCTNENLRKGMSRSIQKLQARTNDEALAATEPKCSSPAKN